MGNTGSASEADKNIQRLTSVATILENKEALYRKSAMEEIATAGRLAKKDRPRARQALQRARTLNANADKVANTVSTVQNQMLALQSLQLNKEVISALKESNAIMTALCQNKDVRNADEILGEIRDHMNLTDQVSDALQQPLQASLNDADMDLDRELDMLADADVHATVTTTATEPGIAHTPLAAAITQTAAPQRAAAVNRPRATVIHASATQ